MQAYHKITNFIMGSVRRVEFAPVINCIVRPNAQNFFNHIATMFFPILWSSCTKENLTATMVSFFTGHPKMWKDVLSQKHCYQAPFKLSQVPGVQTNQDKPIFFKVVAGLYRRHPGWQALKTLLVDDTRYKNQLNSTASMICPPSFDPYDPQQDAYYLTRTLLPWLKGWSMSQEPDEYILRNMLKNDKDMVSRHVSKQWDMWISHKK